MRNYKINDMKIVLGEKMRVVITGATSMIGVALVKECIQNGDTVLAIVRKKTTRIHRLPKSEFLHIWYVDLEQLKDVVLEDEKAYDVFYHFAWEGTQKEERDNPKIQESNIRTSLEAVALAKRLGCQKFIGAGSQAEYGMVHGVIDETTPCNPESAYGMAKLAANYLTRKYCDQNHMIQIWGRIFSVYGCNDNEGTMVNYALNQFLSNEKAYFSSAENIWNYLYEEDAGKMFYLLGKLDVDAGIYCIASEDNRMLKSYIKEIEKISGKENLCVFQTSALTKIINLEVSTEKMKKAIRYYSQISFRNGVEKVISFKNIERLA